MNGYGKFEKGKYFIILKEIRFHMNNFKLIL